MMLLRTLTVAPEVGFTTPPPRMGAELKAMVQPVSVTLPLVRFWRPPPVPLPPVKKFDEMVELVISNVAELEIPPPLLLAMVLSEMAAVPLFCRPAPGPVPDEEVLLETCTPLSVRLPGFAIPPPPPPLAEALLEVIAPRSIVAVP